MTLCQEVEKDTQHPLDAQLYEITKESDHLKQDKFTHTHIQFHSLIYLGLGIEAKSDIYHRFAHIKPISIKLDPPSTIRPPLLQVKQEGKQPIITTDFYFINIKPSDLVIPPPHVNNEDSSCTR